MPAPLITRRAALRHCSAGALLSLGLWPGALRAAEETAGSAFRFVVINDTHCQSTDCGRYLERAVAAMKGHNPVFCLHAGDLTDQGERAWLEAVRDAFARLGAPTWFTPGNHDYVSDTDRKPYEAVFPGRLNFTFDHAGWQFLGLDTTDGQRYENTTIQAATLTWLDTQLPRLNRRQPLVVCTHFPLAAGVKMRPRNADALLERLRDFNVQAVFNGHYHGFTENLWRGAPITTNRCCSLKRGNHDGTKEKGWFLCTAQDGRVSREFIPFAPA
jgi:3',5'-cyclic AMP phosphodiesterase CpdA